MLYLVQKKFNSYYLTKTYISDTHLLELWKIVYGLNISMRLACTIFNLVVCNFIYICNHTQIDTYTHTYIHTYIHTYLVLNDHIDEVCTSS